MKPEKQNRKKREENFLKLIPMKHESDSRNFKKKLQKLKRAPRAPESKEAFSGLRRPKKTTFSLNKMALSRGHKLRNGRT